MAFSKVPTDWIPGYSSDGTDLTIPIASIPNLTSGEANTTTGDIRKILFHLMEKLQAVWDAQAVADRPTKLAMLKSSQYNAATGKIVTTYNQQLTLDVGSLEVSAE